MRIFLTLTLGGSALTLMLLALRYVIFRKLPSTVYYYAWLLVLLRFVLPLPGFVPAGVQEAAPAQSAVSTTLPMAEDETVFRPALPSENRAPMTGIANPATETELPETVREVRPAGPSAVRQKGFDWRSPTLWFGIWATGTALCLGATVAGYVLFTRRVRRSMSEADLFDRAIYASLPGKKPALYRCAAYKTPLMFGVLHPVITLPERAYNEELLTNILRHELLHYRRRDTLFKWFSVAVLSTQWFNPLAWLARREIGRACELSCDEMLLRDMNRAEKQSYGNTLLAMAVSGALPAGVVATTFSTEKRNLKERLEQIMTYKKSGARVLAAVLAIALLAGCGMAAGPQAQKEDAATPVPDADDGVIRVSTVDEFLAAIAPNTTIELAAGEYDLSTASNYGTDTHSSWYSWNGVWGEEGQTHAELVIHGVDGLTIIGEGMGKTIVSAVPRYANVIHFQSCSNLSLASLTAGHTTEPGFCAGGVLRLENCTDTSVTGCGLYGCGTIGVQAQDCAGLTVTASDIYECSYGAVDVHQCRDVLVTGCNIYSHGTREGQGEAMNLFSVSYGEGFTVYNCRIHDNRAQYLLNNSFTKNVLFLSNEVLNNAFGASVFSFQQYGATVDGCVFEGNDVRGGWYSGSGIYAADIDGNALEGAVLAEMVRRDIPPERVMPKPADLAQTAEVPIGGEVLVKTVDEFLASIGPDRTIVLDGELFDLSTASNYGGIGTEYYFWQESPDGPALVIHDASGLSIRANDTASGATTLAAIPRYANVLSFRNCDNLFLGGFTAGHTEEPGVCSGGVLEFRNCNQVMIEKMRLYGCGILGIQASNCTSLSVLRSEIYECSQGAATFFQCDGLSFTDCDIHDVPSPAFIFRESGDKTWNGAPIVGLESEYDVDENGALAAFERPYKEEEEYHGALEDLANPFAGEPAHRYQAGTPQALFAASVQKAIADGDWEALADRIAFPIQFFTDGYSFVIHDREEYLIMVQDGYFTNELFTETFQFQQRIADAPLDEYGSCVFGDTCLDHLIAFACYGNEAAEDNLYINAISVLTPFWPGRSAEDGYAPAVPPTPQP